MSDDRMDDLAFQNNPELDPEYQAQFGEGLGEEEAERKLGFPTLPKGRYLLRPIKAFGGVTSEKKSPFAKLTLEVVKGAGDTEGQRVFDSMGIYFKASPQKFDRKTKQMVTLEGKALDDKRKSRNALLNRIAKRLGLSMPYPPNFLESGAQAYAAQVEEGKLNDVILDINVKKGDDGVMRNEVDWGTIALPTEDMVDSKGNSLGKTAIQDLEEAIAKANAAQTKRGSRGSTAGQFAGTNPLA